MATNTVYVGNLSWETDSDSLGNFFSDLSVSNAEVQYYGNGSRSKGWGLVTFSDSSDVKKAIENFNDVEMGGRKLIVREDRGATAASSKDEDSKEEIEDQGPTTKVFVGNLTWDTTNDDVAKTFSSAGSVANVEIQCRADGRSKGWAVVTFDDISGAQKAVDTLEGVEIDGRAIKVQFQRAVQKKTRTRTRSRKKNSTKREPKKMAEAGPSKNIFVGNLPWSATDDDLKDMFSGMSPIEANIVQGYDGRSRGYGIVKFGSIDQASKAINSVNGTDYDGRPVVARFDRGE